MRRKFGNLEIRKFIFILGTSLIVASIFFKVVNHMEVKKSEERLTAKLEQNKDASSDEGLVVSNEIGRLTIPSLNIDGIIVEGIDEESIKHNIGHFPGSTMPGAEGNFALAGHRGTLYSNIFDNLNKINLGDEIFIETAEGTYEYKVTDSFVVEDYETNVLDNVPGEKNITLITCTLDGKKRLIVKGNLTEEEKDE